MARKISGGLVGQPSVGALNVAPTAVITAAEDLDITVSPIGTGRFIISGDMQLQAQADLRFADADSSNWVAFQSPAAVSTNVTWTLPSGDGTSNQVLTTNGTGTLSWSSKDVAIADQTISSSTHYITMTTATSGVASTLNTSSSRLTFQPSTGTITATVIVESSSISLKENFRPIDNALDAILQLQGLIYDRKDGSQKDEVGLVAEHVNNIIPNVVGKDEKGNPTTIAYQRLTAFLIEAIKTLKSEIDSLRK
jgi:hypothetical protein